MCDQGICGKGNMSDSLTSLKSSKPIGIAADSAPIRKGMKCIRRLDGTSDCYVYREAVDADRPATDYAARVIPHCEGVSVPLKNARILWQR